MRRRVALVTGITGQDGSYLTEFLLAKGYAVHGIVRRASTFNSGRIYHLSQETTQHRGELTLHYGDLANGEQLTNLIYNLQPREVYHLGAQTDVMISFEMPEYTGDVTGLGVTRILEAIRRSGARSRLYQASSSEMFGESPPPQDEKTPFRPASPYSAAKAYGFHMTLIYRQAYGLFAANGILFNHESPRRGEMFVTRKITKGVAAILSGRRKKLPMGNLDAKRDWGYAPEYVDAMWRVLQHDHPDDFVIGTGETHSVREFIQKAFAYVNKDWRDYVTRDPDYFRPLDVHSLKANAAKARRLLKWSPRVRFGDLVHIMMDADLEAEGLESPGKGKEVVSRLYGTWAT